MKCVVGSYGLQVGFTFANVSVFGEGILQRLLIGVEAQSSNEQLALVVRHGLF